MSHHDKYGIATAEPVSYSHTMNVPAYLARIGYSGPVTPTAEVLRALHRAHMLSVPFENLDISRGRKIVVDQDACARKIVEERRGGFCYELNGLFNELLLDLGYTTRLVSARVFNPVEWFEDLLTLAPRNTGSLVFDGDHDALGFGDQADGGASTILHSIVDEIGYGAS